MAGNIYYKSAETLYDEMVQPIKGEVNTDSQSLTYRQDMPVAQELSYITMNQDELVKRIHAKTALENGYDEDLIEKCRDMGVEWNRKTKATTTLKLTGDPNSKCDALADSADYTYRYEFPRYDYTVKNVVEDHVGESDLGGGWLPHYVVVLEYSGNTRPLN